jgi:[ribosomal protein S18]-alanine N-acetyltransferase
MSFSIRPMQPADVEHVLELEKKSDGAAHWPRDAYNAMLTIEPDAVVRKLALVAETGGHVLGFIAGRIVLGEAELENICVDAKFQRQGIAGSLLQALAEVCRESGSDELRLEVREGNHAARNFYARAGFVAAGRRRGYYLEPEEDALLLTLPL